MVLFDSAHRGARVLCLALLTLGAAIPVAAQPLSAGRGAVPMTLSAGPNAVIAGSVEPRWGVHGLDATDSLGGPWRCAVSAVRGGLQGALLGAALAWFAHEIVLRPWGPGDAKSSERRADWMRGGAAMGSAVGGYRGWHRCRRPPITSF